ncbi:putative restriction endonuclease S subunit [Klebsiella quasipneumoniae]|uniref:restriction endonuclease subunit S n=1 Tax=Klebsiella quasipneumoniae TaxID=1463165 RepID=UPI001083D00D|nr:restriction endonuclease subunit S [Klebsiella quasipneumoniae]VGE26154.1 putative restriction endonuclease S subunit [Klebsiella quasipneumoniae]VGE50289.1 putative restriction endonuclease S subunit [Klebsiella quasipneumoniae]VGE61417.1 putative restriction endonuclease S subunit [Klebsiella quasipneumoniae]VGE71373.1 putative restriction endonuclease S subunit [Klebsiella quasipneumoniae]VGE73103.1 putative restriction endonuclease S subunit [Klebsiella quasipneumoniae]
MAKYKAYPEYKDSGVEWLGLVPESWTVCRLKNLATIKNGQDYKFVQTDDGYPVMGSGGQFTFASKFMYDKPSVLLGRKGTIDKPLYINEPFWTVDTMYYTELNEGFDAKYLHYLALTIQFSRYSTNTALPSMTQEHLSNYKFSVPKAESERKKITEFLDIETAKIDNLLEKQQQLIELLKEKCQAVISQAVTKGLNPDVPMKDSGVEWLGEVPEHWGVTRAKFISKIFVPQRNKPELNSDSGIFWVTMENMSQHYITYSHQRVSDLAASQSGSKILPKGAVIASCVGNFGVAAINKVDVIINQQLQAFQPVNMIADYLLAIVSISKNYFELIGTAATLIYVNKEGFENLPVLVPPESEQNSICKFINDNNEKFELLINHSIKQINLLQERRTALISAAVTGKIDVRDWVAPDTQNVEEPQEATA